MLKLIKKVFVTTTKKIDKKLYRNKDFVVISNNCWGAEIYNRLGLEYNTPFVGLFIYGPDYIKLLENFDYYIDKKLLFVSKSKWTDSEISYPIGILDDIEIHFIHYKNRYEANTKWNRRLHRMKQIKDKNKYYIKICDRDLTDKKILIKFHQLNFKNKVSFGIFQINEKNHFKINENENNQFAPDGIELFRYSFKYIDVFKWINSGKVTKNMYSKMKSFTDSTKV